MNDSDPANTGSSTDLGLNFLLLLCSKENITTNTDTQTTAINAPPTTPPAMAIVCICGLVGELVELGVLDE